MSSVENIAYIRGSDPDGDTGHCKARQLGGYEARFNMASWRAVLADYRNELGADPDGYGPAPE